MIFIHLPLKLEFCVDFRHECQKYACNIEKTFRWVKYYIYANILFHVDIIKWCFLDLMPKNTIFISIGKRLPIYSCTLPEISEIVKQMLLQTKHSKLMIAHLHKIIVYLLGSRAIWNKPWKPDNPVAFFQSTIKADYKKYGVCLFKITRSLISFRAKQQAHVSAAVQFWLYWQWLD